MYIFRCIYTYTYTERERAICSRRTLYMPTAACPLRYIYVHLLSIYFFSMYAYIHLGAYTYMHIDRKRDGERYLSSSVSPPRYATAPSLPIYYIYILYHFILKCVYMYIYTYIYTHIHIYIQRGRDAPHAPSSFSLYKIFVHSKAFLH